MKKILTDLMMIAVILAGTFCWLWILFIVFVSALKIMVGDCHGRWEIERTTNSRMSLFCGSVDGNDER